MEQRDGVTGDRITCTKCGRSGPYRPEMAGRKLKCKCGNVIQVPAAEPAHEEEPIRLDPIAPARKAKPAPVDDGDEYDIQEPPPELNRSVQRPADVVAYRSAPIEAEEKAVQAAPTFPGFMRPKTYTADSGAEQSQLIKIVIVLAIIVTVIGGSVFAIRYFAGSHSTATGAGATQLGQDADVQSMMQDQYYKEVHAWFQEDSSRIMGPWSQSQALSQADRWTNMGAKTVYAFGSRMSTVAVIELPDDPAKRKQLFDWQAQWHREHFEKVWSDMGQKYLMIQVGI